MKKREKSEDKKYWEWIKGELIADLADYEGRRRWIREPRDRAWANYRTKSEFLDLDEIFRRFFSNDFW